MATSNLHAFDYLADPLASPPAATCVVFGDEPFLKQLVLKELCAGVLGAAREETPFAAFEGKSVEWRDVMDELSTVALFGGERRFVVIHEADDFVSAHRAQLEDYVARPKATGVLVLEVDAWPRNTRLYKSLAKEGLQIECRPPEKIRGKRKTLDEDRLCKWLTQWSNDRHQATLQRPAAKQLIELVGPQFGLLDQELAKLALHAGPGEKVTAEMVREVVGGWRTKTTWELIDAALEGDAGEALRQFDRLLQAGEHPVALLGQISWSLRRFAAAARIYWQAERDERPIHLGQALQQAGIPKWPPQALENAERQIKQLGRQRAGRLFQWLLDVDLSLKGSHSSPARARFALETLLLKLSRQLQRQLTSVV